jgi:hypothetical protein
VTREWLERGEFEERIPLQPCISWVLKDLPTLKAAEFKVLVVISSFADPDGTKAYPSYETIASLAQVNVRTARRAVVQLDEAHGLIRVVRNAGGNATWRGDRRPNLYTVIRPEARRRASTPLHNREDQSESGFVLRNVGAPRPPREVIDALREGAGAPSEGVGEFHRKGVGVQTRGLGDPPTIHDHPIDHPETIRAFNEKSTESIEASSADEAKAWFRSMRELLKK